MELDQTVLRDETVAEAVRARLEGDERRAEDRDRLARLVESVTQPRGTYRPRAADDPGDTRELDRARSRRLLVQARMYGP